MKHSQKAKMILSVCMLLVGLFSAYSLYKAFRPSAGLPYEQLTMDQAKKFMTFEEGYVLADVRPAESYDHAHVEGAVSIPYDTLVERALIVLPDKTQMIYVYGDRDEQSGNACRKLSELGYTGVTQITGMKDWIGEVETEEGSEEGTEG